MATQASTQASHLPPSGRTTTAPFRDYSPHEMKIRTWILRNRGVLSRVAKELSLSVAYVQRIAYNRGDPSKGRKVERKLKEMGCPLIQRFNS